MIEEPILPFTGERLVPGQVEPDLYYEHISRYQYAALYTPGKRILDAGCGTGYGTALLAASAATVIGTDISTETIRYARDKYVAPNLVFLTAACEALPFADHSFDLIVTFEVIEHLADPAGYLHELARVLAPRGALILSTPNKRQYSDALPGYENPYHLHEFYASEWRRLLSEVYPEVQHIAQDYAQGLSFRPELTDTGQPFITEMVRQQQNEAGREPNPDDAQFFLAICGHENAALPPAPGRLYRFSESNILAEKDRWIQALTAQVASGSAEVQQANTVIKGLQTSLAEQSAWAQRSVADVGTRDATILQLQAELSARLDEIARQNTRLQTFEQQFGQRLRRQLGKLPARFKTP